jgi:hypothetical protein
MGVLVTQVAIEVLRAEVPRVRVTQAQVEVLGTVEEVAFRPAWAVRTNTLIQGRF